MVAVVVSTANTDGAPDSVPRRIFEALPEAEIEVERFVPLGETAIPYFWLRGADLSTFERTLEGYPEVSTVERLERVEEGALYRVDWEIDSPVIHCIQRAGAQLVEAHGDAARWKLTVWFEPGDDASDLLTCCRERDVPLEVERIESIADLVGGGAAVVTANQQEALTRAYEQGYFERPREISQRELADGMGISAAALGVRLRRGTANVVEHLFFE